MPFLKQVSSIFFTVSLILNFILIFMFIDIATAIARRNEILTNVKNLSHDEAAQIKKNLTKTIIISLSFYIVCDIAYSLLVFVILYYPNFFHRYNMIATIVFNIVPAFNLFIYYYFNKQFKKGLWSIFQR